MALFSFHEYSDFSSSEQLPSYLLADEKIFDTPAERKRPARSSELAGEEKKKMGEKREKE